MDELEKVKIETDLENIKKVDAALVGLANLFECMSAMFRTDYGQFMADEIASRLQRMREEEVTSANLDLNADLEAINERLENAARKAFGWQP